jgi:hypothetical protein
MSSSNLAKASLRLPCGREEVIVVVEAFLVVGGWWGGLRVVGMGGDIRLIDLVNVI